MPAIIILIAIMFVFMLFLGFAFEQYKSPLQIIFETLGILLVFAGCGACVFMIFLL
jgi:Na+-translocating ferredoxin:NAD+ oxidoreductase RNF subunit RnfB